MRIILICLLFLPLQNAISQVFPAKQLQLDPPYNNMIKYLLKMPTGNLIPVNIKYEELFGNTFDGLNSSAIDEEFQRIILEGNIALAMLGARNRYIRLELENLKYEGIETWDQELIELQQRKNRVKAIFRELQDNPGNSELFSRLKCTYAMDASDIDREKACTPYVNKMISDNKVALNKLDKELVCSANFKDHCSASTLLKHVLMNMALEGEFSETDFSLGLSRIIQDFEFEAIEKEFLRKRAYQKQNITLNELRSQLVVIYKTSIKPQLKELSEAKHEVMSLILKQTAEDSEFTNSLQDYLTKYFRIYKTRNNVLELYLPGLNTVNQVILKLKHLKEYSIQLSRQRGSDIIIDLGAIDNLNNQPAEARSQEEINIDTEAIIINKSSDGELR